MSTSRTPPQSAKRSRRSSTVVLQGMLPTYNLDAFVAPASFAPSMMDRLFRALDVTRVSLGRSRASRRRTRAILPTSTARARRHRWWWVGGWGGGVFESRDSLGFFLSHSRGVLSRERTRLESSRSSSRSIDRVRRVESIDRVSRVDRVTRVDRSSESSRVDRSSESSSFAWTRGRGTGRVDGS